MAWGAVFRPQSPQVQVITTLFAGLLIVAAVIWLVVAGLVMWVPGCLVYLSAILARVARWYNTQEA
jgi:hypothetical protein